MKNFKYSFLLIISIFCLSGSFLSGCHKTDKPAEGNGIRNRANDDLSKYEGSSPKERALIIEGNDRFHAGDFEGADSCYIAAMKYNPKSLVSLMNEGLANLGKINNIKENMKVKGDSILSPEDSAAVADYLQIALESFKKAGDPHVKKGNISSLAFYNAGNMMFIDEQYGEAIELYKESLRLDPDNDKTRRNLRIAQLKQNEQNQDQNKDQNQNQNQDQNQDKNKDKEQQPQNQQPAGAINSDAVLENAERKENQKRLQMKIREQEPSENSGSSRYGW